MGYPSIDSLQKVLSEQIFAHSKDAKKAAGRALGTLIEIITYYLLREWGLSDSISIERGLAEYGNPTITHNVEFTLHPILGMEELNLNCNLPITSRKIIDKIRPDASFITKSNTLLDKQGTIKNACIVAENDSNLLLSQISGITPDDIKVRIIQQYRQPYAMFECKRVGVEEGNKKGPQTIEKAKQGAYVAQNTSSLQKIRTDNGTRYGVIYNDGHPIIRPYTELLQTIIESDRYELLKDFILSIGVVSNHGNWFTEDNQNKELKVLSQSYDWLLFLSDRGLAHFITDLILNPVSKKYQPIQDAFVNSYKEGKKNNTFTKVRMNIEAHRALCHYFCSNISAIEGWFNVITPKGEDISKLKKELFMLKNKNWRDFL